MSKTDETCDVIVVGGGGAGLAAAIEARQAGAYVILIEKNAALGGSTAWSIGSITATGTPHQARRGIDDNPHDHWRDMAGFNGDLDGRDNPDLRRVLAERCRHLPLVAAARRALLRPDTGAAAQQAAHA